MKPQSRFSCAALISVLVLAGCADSGAGSGNAGAETPEAAFNAFKTAVGNNDWKTAAQQLTVESQEMMAGGMMFVGAFATVSDDEAQAKAKEEAYNALLARHGINKDELDRQQASGDAPTDPSAAMKQATAPVKDKPAFIADMIAWIDENSDSDNKMMSEIKSGELQDLKVDGEQATATLVMTKDGEESKENIEFRQVNGKWFIHLPMEG